MSESFFEKYIDKVDFDYLCQNKNISISFFEKYIEKSQLECFMWRFYYSN